MRSMKVSDQTESDLTPIIPNLGGLLKGNVLSDVN